MSEKKIIRPADPAAVWQQQVCTLFNKIVGGVPADSTAADVAGIVADFNELLALLRGLNTR